MIYVYSEGGDMKASMMVYDWPFFRIAPYAVGLLLALLMHKTEGKIRMNKVSTCFRST